MVILLIGVCGLFRVTCDEDRGTRQSHHHKNTFYTMTVGGTKDSKAPVRLHTPVESRFTLLTCAVNSIKGISTFTT